MIVCGTGHRLQYLPCKFEHRHPFKISKLKQLERYFNQEKVDVVISGMAIGWDMWLAWTAIKIGIPMHAYVPFEGQDSLWSSEHRDQFHSLLNKASCVKYICDPGYAGWKMIKRDKVMVDDSDMTLSLWNPLKRSGGTWTTVRYATYSNRRVVNFWENPQKLLDKKDLR